MAHVSTTTFTAGSPALASAVNANFDAIKAAVNGGLDATNLANAAVTENKIEDLAVTAGKIGALAVTEGKIGALAVTNAKVATGIDAAKLANGLVSNAEFQYLDGVTSAIQTQLNAKQATVTGGASTIVSANLTASRALVSDVSGKVDVSLVTATELGYLDGVTSALQTQLNAKQATITGGATTITGSDLTASRALASDVSGKVAVSAVTSTELGYLDGVTSNLQDQLNNKSVFIVGGASSIVTLDLLSSRALASNASGKVVATAVTATELGYLDGVTSGIQTQINGTVKTTGDQTVAGVKTFSSGIRIPLVS